MQMQEPRTVIQEKVICTCAKSYFAVYCLPITFLLLACIFERMKTGTKNYECTHQYMANLLLLANVAKNARESIYL